MAPPATCDQPTSVSVNTAATTATINWVLEPDATATQIQYRVHPSFGGSPPNTVIAGAGATSQALSGLQSATMYQSRLRHNCDSIGISPWKFRTFMTAPMRLGQSDRISTYPNPANDVVNIAISNDAHLEVKITDLFGREMIVGKTSGSNLLTLNVSALQAGVYLVEVGHDFENASTELLQIIR